MRIGSVLALSMSAIYWLAPTPQLADPRYSLLLSYGIVFGHSLDLSTYFQRPLNPRITVDDHYPYHLEAVGDHLYYAYPVGGSLLAMPVVALASLTGDSPVDKDGVYCLECEAAIQKLLAAALMGLWCWLVFQTCCQTLGIWPSVLVTVIAGLGTQALSTASRQLFSDTWGLVILQAVLWLLLRDTPTRLSPLLLGTMLAWLYIVRPTYSVAIVAVLVYLALRQQWRLLSRTALVGSCWFVAFVTFSWRYYHLMLPPYYQPGKLGFAAFWTALPGNLVSPSRGLFVFVPVLPIVLGILVLAWRHIPNPRLVVISIIAAAGYLVVTSGVSNNWWGGYSYGPRLMTGSLPWFVNVTVQALAGLAKLPRMRRPVFAVCAVAGALSIAINVEGTVFNRAILWNAFPVSVDEHPERVWDWRDPQFLAGFRRRP